MGKAPQDTVLSPLARATQHEFAFAVDRKQLGDESAGLGAVSLQGHQSYSAAFKDWKQQVPVIGSRGVLFTHHRNLGMSLRAFYLP